VAGGSEEYVGCPGCGCTFKDDRGGVDGEGTLKYQERENRKGKSEEERGKLLSILYLGRYKIL